jgi:hypothetical protein
MKHLLPAWIWLRPVIIWLLKTVFTELIRILVSILVPTLVRILLGLFLRGDHGD